MGSGFSAEREKEAFVMGITDRLADRASRHLLDRGYDLKSASRAIRALVRNPDDLPQVFTIIDALSGDSLNRVLRRLRATPGGATLLHDKPDVARLLVDREALRAMPEDSLGRAYLRFVESEGISAEGIIAASQQRESSMPRTEDGEYVHARMRDTHDLWHTVTGYRGDVVGEISLLAFTASQTANPAVTAIVIVAILKGFAKGNLDVVWDGFRRGLRAKWIIGEPWEALLARPLEEVRTALRIEPLRAYEPVTSDDLRRRGAIAA